MAEGVAAVEGGDVMIVQVRMEEVKRDGIGLFMTMIPGCFRVCKLNRGREYKQFW